MAKVRRVARKLESPHAVTFDEQLWPINIALLVLAGFVAGAIMAVSRFDDPRPLYNGWVRLITLSLSVGLLMWLASWIDSHRIRRGMQLAALLSLLTHVALMVLLYNKRLLYPTEPEPEAIAETVIEFVEPPPETPPDQYLTAPVEVEMVSEVPSEVVREDVQAPETPVENRSTPIPGSTPEVQPNSVTMPEIEEAAPRRAEQLSRLSKQSLRTEAQAVESITAPQVPVEQEPTPRGATANVQPIERQETVVPADRSATDEEPRPNPQQQTTQIARRETNQPIPDESSSTPSLDRRVNEPQAVPHVDAEVPQQVAVSPAASPAEVQPNTVVSRQDTTGPQMARQESAEPREATGIEVARIDAPRQTISDASQLAQSPQPAPARTLQEAALPSSAAEQVQNSPDSLEAGSTLPAAASTQLARGQSSLPTSASAESGADADLPNSANVAAVDLERAEQAESPSMSPTISRSVAANRGVQSAPTEASPANIESPAVARAAEVSPAFEPARSALTRGAAGSFGQGQEQNFDRGLSATEQPAMTPSAAANRASAAQQAAAAAAPSPSLPSTIAKSIAGANVPSATLMAEDVPDADAVGSQRPSTLEASSSAAIQRADSSAPASRVTAAAGKAELDTGPTQIVANIGSGRAAGGGAPNVRLNTQGPQLTKSTSGGAPLASIAALATAPMPEAPSTSDGGAPAATSGNPAATAATRAAANGSLPTVGAEAPHVSGGPSPVTTAQVARAASGSETVTGPLTPGSVPRPTRTIGRTFAADTQAELPQMTANPSASESPGGSIGQVSSEQTIRSTAGLPGRALTRAVGAEAGQAMDAPAAGSPGTGLNRRASENANNDAPSVAATAIGGSLAKSTRAGLPSGVAATIEDPTVSGTPSTTDARPDALAMATLPGTPSRGASSLPVDVAALSGSGGLGPEISPQVGSLSRRAQRDSEVVHSGTARFLRRTVGGPLAVDGQAREPTEAFAGRRGKRQGTGSGPGQPSERTERAIELGLDFLARHQSPDGSWSLNHFGGGRPGYERERAFMQSDTAATGLALLAFMGAGYDHFDDKYQQVVQGGLRFLVSNQRPDGDLYIAQDSRSNESAWLYSHGIASIALCEAYGMTGDDALREPAQKALDFILAAQHPQLGGWRYRPQASSDTSVSGWQLMALKSGELAGLNVPSSAYDKVRRWLDSAKAPRSGGAQYVYDPFAPDTRRDGRIAAQGRRPTRTMSAVGLLMRLYVGSNRDDPEMIRGAEYLLQNLPALGTERQPTRDTYYWYYATQVMFHMRGKYWTAWNDRLHPLLVDRQIQTGPFAGSWDPGGPIPDAWGPQAGRIYVTTMNLLSLEVYYRHLPLYESTAK